MLVQCSESPLVDRLVENEQSKRNRGTNSVAEELGGIPLHERPGCS